MTDYHTIAADILSLGPQEALGEHLSPSQEREWRAAAQAYVDHNGDSADLPALLSDADEWDEYQGQAMFWQDTHGGDYMDYDQWKDAR